MVDFEAGRHLDLLLEKLGAGAVLPPRSRRRWGTRGEKVGEHPSGRGQRDLKNEDLSDSFIVWDLAP
ncbi:MAG: hypothetical protein WEG36_14540 [Gemmatimonadota bacterium]